jgi:uncharacterized protein YlxP (DUF503 family)
MPAIQASVLLAILDRASERLKRTFQVDVATMQASDSYGRSGGAIVSVLCRCYVGAGQASDSYKRLIC